MLTSHNRKLSAPNQIDVFFPVTKASYQFQAEGFWLFFTAWTDFYRYSYPMHFLTGHPPSIGRRKGSESTPSALNPFRLNQESIILHPVVKIIPGCPLSFCMKLKRSLRRIAFDPTNRWLLMVIIRIRSANYKRCKDGFIVLADLGLYSKSSNR